MSKIAVIFPGQGSQYVGMGKKIIDTWKPASTLLNNAEKHFDKKIKDICLNGPKELLDVTENAQPAIFTINLLYWSWLKENIKLKPDYTAGHSLGEYSALVAAEVLDYILAMDLVKKRAEIMAEAARNYPGGMMAVIGLGADQVEKAIGELSNEVQIANYNSGQQVVISGTLSGLETIKNRINRFRAKKLVPLAVSGAFHSLLMIEAEKKFNDVLKEMHLNEAVFPIINNFSALPVTDPEEIKIALTKQMSSSVKWEQSVKWLINNKVKTFIEVGPGQILKGLIRRIDAEVVVFSLDGFDNLNDFKVKWKKYCVTV